MAASAQAEPSASRAFSGTRRLSWNRLLAALFWAIVVGNAALMVWLWVHGGNLHVHRTGDLLNSIGRITGLLGAYSALLQVLLLARLPWLERLVGFDRLTVWHRWNGHACLYLILGHVVFTVYGYALLDKISVPNEISTMLGGGIYPGMITATVGTALLLVVTVSSIVIVRRKLRYEAWYAVHLTAYASIALGWFHQIPTGNELVLDRLAANYWRGLYLVTLALVLIWRLLLPAANALRFRLRVEEVVEEGPGVVSVRIRGRKLERLQARPGQFFLWRFLARGRWWTAHPFSLSAAPDGRSLRITVKALGDHTSRMGDLKPGTRVVAEGPFGVFTAAARRREKVVLIAGGIGITPIRALLEELDGDVTVLYRVVLPSDVLFRAELDQLAASRGIRVEYVVGDHATAAGRGLLSPGHLRQLVPDIDERDVYLCGPPAMTSALERSLRQARVPRSHVRVERFAL
jgi:predicted ferric reductase